MTRLFLICDCKCRSCLGFCQRVYDSGRPDLSTICENRAVFTFINFMKKKSARELRQRRSDYRCCIPALAGFVSLRSIAPDGGKTFAQDHHRATATRERGDQMEMTKL